MILGKTRATPRRTGSRRPLLHSLSAPASPASPPLVPPVLVVEAAPSFGAELDLRDKSAHREVRRPLHASPSAFSLPPSHAAGPPLLQLLLDGGELRSAAAAAGSAHPLRRSAPPCSSLLPPCVWWRLLLRAPRGRALHPRAEGAARGGARAPLPSIRGGGHRLGPSAATSFPKSGERAGLLLPARASISPAAGAGTSANDGAGGRSGPHPLPGCRRSDPPGGWAERTAAVRNLGRDPGVGKG